MGVSTPAGHFPLKNQGGLQGENAEIVVHNSLLGFFSSHPFTELLLKKKKKRIYIVLLCRGTLCARIREGKEVRLRENLEADHFGRKRGGGRRGVPL